MNYFFKIVIFFFFINLSFAQSSEQQKLEERKAQVLKEISETKARLEAEKKKEKSVLKQISQQRNLIQLRQKLLSTTAKQTRILSDEIYLTQLEMNKLNRELKVLKEDYEKMIVKSYKSRNEQSRIMFILSSENFLQAYKRIQYMKQYAGFRKMQGEEIKEKQIKLAQAEKRLSERKKEKEIVLEQTEKEKQELEKEKKEQERLAKIIQKDKKKYAAEIDKKQKEAKSIDAKIKSLVAAEIAAANKRNAAKTGKSAPKSGSREASKFVLTAEGKVVSDNFIANKGKLPWPVADGYISLKHGDQPHPVHKNLTIHNSGVEISTKPGSYARAVFGGEVLQVQVISANNKAVYIQHGDFITVYLNLSTVSVTKGQKVSIKQSIGKIHTDSSGSAVIKFLVLQNTTTLNPEIWLNM
ncbi:murein hydrolase activator EnvC [Flavobacterium cucumis]|uniref:Septal ring factor EnvC, activator of murein hydrolases AmiA and AmiB n=1 Tax=Flavobacterium cucumis TaxID=416016 RepID=A0A1M7ZU30_9FLAO|nr:peptidoglycan DD-metalloendopeptidase family protein [Flavobacterium cucumis]SHO72313.1 Septal ring factor EnvC, activator of murein hydrolases AmiA and AmiB [Flavobacterium cucumis]